MMRYVNGVDAREIEVAERPFLELLMQQEGLARAPGEDDESLRRRLRRSAALFGIRRPRSILGRRRRAPLPGGYPGERLDHQSTDLEGAARLERDRVS